MQKLNPDSNVIKMPLNGIKASRQLHGSIRGSYVKSYDSISQIDQDLKQQTNIESDPNKEREAIFRKFGVAIASPACLLLTILFTMTLIFAVVISQKLSRHVSQHCDGPPYLYVSRHGYKNVLKYSRNGCLISEKVLWGNYNKDSSLRGMVQGIHNGR